MRVLFLSLMSCLILWGSDAGAAESHPLEVSDVDGIERINYKGWEDAYRLSNGTVELVFVPSIGRIMRYGYIDGENCLWENQELWGQPPAGVGEDWKNFGGDKIWPWPMSRWFDGITFLPPRSWDAEGYTAEVLGDRRLLVRSLGSYEGKFRVVREIALAAEGSQALVRSLLVGPEESVTEPIALWSVSQVPVPEFLIVEAGMESGQFKQMEVSPWEPSEAFGDDRIFVFESPPSETRVKVGLNGDAASAVLGNTLFFQKQVEPELGEDDWEPFERLQVFWEGTPPLFYSEIEFTSPRVRQVGQVAITTVWDLRSFDGEVPDRAEMIAEFEKLDGEINSSTVAVDEAFGSRE